METKERELYRKLVSGLQIGRPKLIAVYLLLISPNSSVQKAASGAQPDNDQTTAATNVVAKIAPILGLLATGQDYKDLITTLVTSTAMPQNAAGQYALSTDPSVLAYLDPVYDGTSGCPDANGSKLLYQSIQ